MEASPTAADLLTLAWIKIVMSYAAPIKVKATTSKTITTIRSLGHGLQVDRPQLG